MSLMEYFYNPYLVNINQPFKKRKSNFFSLVTVNENWGHSIWIEIPNVAVQYSWNIPSGSSPIV